MRWWREMQSSRHVPRAVRQEGVAGTATCDAAMRTARGACLLLFLRRAVASLLLLTILLWHTAQPRAVGPAEGTQLDNSSPTTHHPSPTNHLLLGTYNIHGGVGTDDRRDLNRVAKNMQGLDFVALNEVHGSSWRLLNNQAATLGRLTNRSWLFAPASQSWSGALVWPTDS